MAGGLAQLNLSWTVRRSRFVDVLALAIPVLAIIASLVSEERGLRLLLSRNPLHAVVPVKGVDFLRTQPPGNIFNDWEIGGFLTWELNDRQKIAAHGFVSDTDLIMKKYFRFSYSKKDWDEVILGNDVKYFFMRRQTFEENRQASWAKELEGPNWKLVFVDNSAVIFTR